MLGMSAAAHGVAVHRRVVGGRHVERRLHGCGEHARQRTGHREDLGRDGAGYLSQDVLLALAHSDHG